MKGSTGRARPHARRPDGWCGSSGRCCPVSRSHPAAAPWTREPQSEPHRAADRPEPGSDSRRNPNHDVVGQGQRALRQLCGTVPAGEDAGEGTDRLVTPPLLGAPPSITALTSRRCGETAADCGRGAALVELLVLMELMELMMVAVRL